MVTSSLLSTTRCYFSDKVPIKFNVTVLLTYRLCLTSQSLWPEMTRWSVNDLKHSQKGNNNFLDNSEDALPFSMLSPPLNQRPLLIFLSKIPVESSYLMLSRIQVLLPKAANLLYSPYNVSEVYLLTHFIECHIIFMFIKQFLFHIRLAWFSF